VIISPPQFENFFFDAVGDEKIDGQTFGERALQLADKYKVKFVGPPLG
jgi:hypothetical protein